MSGKTFTIGNVKYDRFVEEMRDCSGGCLRPRGSVQPMLRPAGGFRVPSDVMFVLQQPNSEDDKTHGCLTIGPEDYRGGGPDPTATRIMTLAETIGRSYKEIYIVNSLLCAQPGDKSDWSKAFRPCLDHGWLRRSISICDPKVVVTIGKMSLKSTKYALTGDASISNMKQEVNRVKEIDGISVYPLYHVSDLGCANRPNYQDDWSKLADFIEKDP